MSIRKKLKKISDRRERHRLKDLIDRYNLQEFNFEIDDGHVTTLSIKFKGLKKMPDEITKFYRLEHLDLSRNEIKHIQNLDKLIYLKKLSLRENKIREIEGIHQNQMLEELDLADNQIIEIQNLYNLHELESLILSRNEIRKIEGLGNLRKLKSLKLNNNPIFRIENLNNLRNLQLLLLSRANVKEMRGLDPLTNLRDLDLASNQIKKIKGLEHNLMLRRLNLKNNQIREIENIEHLTYLEEIYLDFNPLIPKDKPYIGKSAKEIIKWIKQKKIKEKKEAEKQRKKEKRIQEQIEEELSYKTVIYKHGPDEETNKKSNKKIDKMQKQKSEEIIENKRGKNIKYNHEHKKPTKKGDKMDSGRIKRKISPFDGHKQNIHKIEEPKGFQPVEKKGKNKPEIIKKQKHKNKRPQPPPFPSQTSSMKGNEDKKSKEKIKIIEKSSTEHNSRKSTQPQFAGPAWMKMTEKAKENDKKIEIPEDQSKNKSERKNTRLEEKTAEKDGNLDKKKKKRTIDPKLLKTVNGKHFSTEEEWLEFAQKLAEKQNFRGAINAYTNVLRINKKQIEAWKNIGIALNNKGNYKEAVKTFKQGIALNPDNSELWMYLGVTFLNLKDFEEACYALQESMTAEQTSSEQLLKIGEEELISDFLLQLKSYYKQIPEHIRRQYEYPKHEKGLLQEGIILNDQEKDFVGKFREFQKQYRIASPVNITADFIIYQLLAFTQNSRLWLAEEHNSNRKIVLKHIIIPKKQKDGKGQHDLIQCLAFREISVLSLMNKTDSTHIIPLLDYFIGTHENEKGIILKFPHYSHGTLGDRIKNKTVYLEKVIEHKDFFPPETILNITIGIIEGIIEIHSQGIVHRDINPNNIIIESTADIPEIDEIKIIDFGIATIPDKFPRQNLLDGKNCGTRGFAAPEQFSTQSKSKITREKERKEKEFECEEKITPNADIYAVGSTIYYAMCLRKFKGKFFLPNYVHDFYQEISFIFPLLQKMLDPEPEKRSNGIDNLQGIVNQLKEIVEKI